MFALILLISFFMALLSLPGLLMEKPRRLSMHNLSVIFLSLGLWILYYFFLNDFIARFLIGLLLLIFAFARLGIYNLPPFLKRPENIAAVHLLIMALIAAMSGLAPAESLISFLIFVPFILTAVQFLEKPCQKYKSKKVENVKLLLELFSLLDGILLFIITLIITSDRVRFLEKIAHQLF